MPRTFVLEGRLGALLAGGSRLGFPESRFWQFGVPARGGIDAYCAALEHWSHALVVGRPLRVTVREEVLGAVIDGAIAALEAGT